MVGSDLTDIEAPRLEYLQLVRLLQWWPIFVALNERYSWNGDLPDRWPSWASTLLGMCFTLGVPPKDLEAIRSMQPHDAGEVMTSWAAERRDAMNQIKLHGE
jgi:hypothetical protein